ncbi:MAG: hypothetical protein ACLUSP_06495 [Christensenellales bacterium]
MRMRKYKWQSSGKRITQNTCPRRLAVEKSPQENANARTRLPKVLARRAPAASSAQVLYDRKGETRMNVNIHPYVTVPANAHEDCL